MWMYDLRTNAPAGAKSIRSPPPDDGDPDTEVPHIAHRPGHAAVRGDTLREMTDDDRLLARAEQALTEIKVNHGLSEEHSAVLAALRIRLKGSDGGSLEQLLEAAEDARTGSLEAKLAEAEHTKKRSLDDLFAEDPKPTPDWPG